MADTTAAAAATTATADAEAGAMLVADNIVLKFGGTVALDGASLVVPRGKVVGVIGPNGAGKTSLLNCISGFYRPQTGTITFDGQSVIGMRPAHIAHLGLARTFQNVELFTESTVLENIMLGRHMHMKSTVFAAGLFTRKARREEEDSRQVVEDVISLLELGPLRKKPVGSMPWAQQKLVEIARALVTEPKLLLLDEPGSGMNREEKEDVARLILRLRNETGLTQVLIEHDVGFIADLCDRVIALDFGRLVASGTAHEVLNDPAVVDAYLGSNVAAS
jgi:branched-chain amino acid transport system ATP-binding protein